MHSTFHLAVQCSVYPVNPPKLSISSFAHVSSTRAKSLITLKFPTAPNRLHLMILHTDISGSLEAVKGSCVSSQTGKQTEGAFYQEEILFNSTLVGQLFLRLCNVCTCQQVWREEVHQAEEDWHKEMFGCVVVYYHFQKTHSPTYHKINPFNCSIPGSSIQYILHSLWICSVQ